MAPIKQIQIPGTNLTMVDGNGDGQFTPNISCYRLKCEAWQCPGKKPEKSYSYVGDDNGNKSVNAKSDYYLDDSRPACPDDESVIRGLKNAGFANAIAPLDLSNSKIDLSDTFPEWACVGGKMDALKTMFEMNVKLKDPDPKIRYDAAAALVALSEKVNWCTLFSIAERELKESPYIDIRVWAAKSLGQPGQCEYIKTLSEAFRSEESDDVRNAIIWALGRIQNHATVETLERALMKDPSPDVRKMAISALTLFRTNDFLANKGRREEKFFCIAPDEGLWDEIYHNFGVDSLLLALRYDSDDNIRMDAAEKLVLFCSPKVTSALIQTLLDEDEDAFVRVQSAITLSLNANLPIVRGALLTVFFDGGRGLDYSPLLDFDPLVDAVDRILNKNRWWL